MPVEGYSKVLDTIREDVDIMLVELRLVCALTVWLDEGAVPVVSDARTEEKPLVLEEGPCFVVDVKPLPNVFEVPWVEVVAVLELPEDVVPPALELMDVELVETVELIGLIELVEPVEPVEPIELVLEVVGDAVARGTAVVSSLTPISASWSDVKLDASELITDKSLEEMLIGFSL